MKLNRKFPTHFTVRIPNLDGTKPIFLIPWSWLSLPMLFGPIFDFHTDVVVEVHKPTISDLADAQTAKIAYEALAKLGLNVMERVTGLQVENGDGVPVDIMEATDWKTSMIQNYPDICHGIGRKYQDMLMSHSVEVGPPANFTVTSGTS